MVSKSFNSTTGGVPYCLFNTILSQFLVHFQFVQLTNTIFR